MTYSILSIKLNALLSLYSDNFIFILKKNNNSVSTNKIRTLLKSVSQDWYHFLKHPYVSFPSQSRVPVIQ